MASVGRHVLFIGELVLGVLVLGGLAGSGRVWHLPPCIYPHASTLMHLP